ncbi:MAG: hypothetical protein ACE5K4_00035 [Candidatus Hydrothermarchaeota archaeon]
MGERELSLDERLSALLDESKATIEEVMDEVVLTQKLQELSTSIESRMSKFRFLYTSQMLMVYSAVQSIVLLFLMLLIVLPGVNAFVILLLTGMLIIFQMGFTVVTYNNKLRSIEREEKELKKSYEDLLKK